MEEKEIKITIVDVIFNRKERKDSTQRTQRKLCDLGVFFGNSAVKKQQNMSTFFQDKKIIFRKKLHF